MIKGTEPVAERMNFETWMHAVDVAVEHRSDKTTKDFPACQYRNWYEHNTPPITAAKMALRNDVF